MKKLFITLALLLVPFLVDARNVTFDDGTTWYCDQYFDSVPLRYGYQYRFYDVWNNPSSRIVYMNSRQVRYKDNSYTRV